MNINSYNQNQSFSSIPEKRPVVFDGGKNRPLAALILHHAHILVAGGEFNPLSIKNSEGDNKESVAAEISKFECSPSNVKKREIHLDRGPFQSPKPVNFDKVKVEKRGQANSAQNSEHLFLSSVLYDDAPSPEQTSNLVVAKKKNRPKKTKSEIFPFSREDIEDSQITVILDDGKKVSQLHLNRQENRYNLPSPAYSD